MSPGEYLERHTELEHRVWWEFFAMKARNFGPDISMDGCVPRETQRRWEGAVGNAAYKLSAGLERGIRARQIAAKTGRDEGEVYDELTKKEQVPG